MYWWSFCGLERGKYLLQPMNLYFGALSLLSLRLYHVHMCKTFSKLVGLMRLDDNQIYHNRIVPSPVFVSIK